MNKLVNNLLLLLDLDYLSKIHLQPSDLVSLIENCCRTLLNLPYQPHIETFYNKEEILIHADQELFELAISNLLENAVKYSPSPAKITILMEEQSSFVHIQIKDQGSGIPKKDLLHIFDRFYAVNKAHSRKLGGAGLGLALVQTIIQKHQGEIKVFSEEHQGTVFHISLPR